MSGLVHKLGVHRPSGRTVILRRFNKTAQRWEVEWRERIPRRVTWEDAADIDVLRGAYGR